MFRRGVLVTVLTVLLSASAAHGATKVIDFDGLANGTNVTDQYAESDGVTFNRPPQDLPQVLSAPGLASSGSQVVVLQRTCECENFTTLDVVGRLRNSANSISIIAGDPLAEEPGSTEITLTARDSEGDAVGTPATARVQRGAPFTQRLEVDAPAGAATITSFDITAADNNRPAFDDLTLGYPDAPVPADFSLTGGLGVLDVLQGQSLADPITINRLNGSSGDITMSVSGLPAGMTGSFSPNPVPGNSNSTTLTVSVEPLAVARVEYSEVTITGTPSSVAVASAPRSTRAIARISENCTHHVAFEFVDLRDPGCLTKSGSTAYQALNTEVLFDGLVLKPLDGDHVLRIDPVAKTIKSDTGATFSVSVLGSPDLPFYYGPIDWNFRREGSTPVPLAQNSNGKPKKLEGIDISGVPFFQGIPLTGISVAVSSSAKAIVTPTIKLDFFPFNYFGALTVNTAFATDNDHGAEFNSLEIKVPKLDVLAMELTGVDLKYQDTGTWSGSANVVLGFADRMSVGAGFGIKQGKFNFLRGAVGGLNAAIGEGIFLQGIAFEVALNPTTLKGQITLSAGPQVAGHTAVSIDGGVTAVLADPWVVEVDGDVKVVRQELANAFVRFNSIGLFEFGGRVHWSLDVVYVDGSVAGWVAGLHNFDVEGGVKGCISVPLLPDPCAGAKVLASNLGIAACVEALGAGVGVASHWGEDFDAFTGCDLSPWRPAEPTAHPAATAQQLIVPAGQSVLAWSLDGADGMAPDVTVTGPGHETVAVSHDSPYVNNASFLALQAEDGRTYIVLRHPKAGRWTITGNGAVPMTRIRQAVGLPRPSVRASVGGHRRARTLSWRLKRIPGQIVHFAEIGTDVRSVITTTSRSHGHVRFHPADGPAGLRKIEAIIEQNGRPRSTIVVASYRAPGMLRPGKPRALRLSRKGQSIIVSFRPNPGLFRHAVYLQLSDGRRLLALLAAKAHRAVFVGVPTSLSGQVTVTGLTRGNSKGPSAHASIKAQSAHTRHTRRRHAKHTRKRKRR